MFLALISFENKKHSVFIMIFIGFLFSALRFNAGFDYPVYYLVASSYLEKSFDIIPSLFVFISREIHPQVFFVLTSFFIIWFYYKIFIFINSEVEISRLAVVFFVFFPLGFFDSFGYIRQFLAIFIFLYALFLYEKNYFQSFFYAFISVLCHSSIIILLPLLFTRFLLIKKFNIYIYIIFLLFFGLAGSQIILMVSYYTGLYYDYFSLYRSNNGYKVFLFFLFIFIYFLFNIKLIRNYEVTQKLFNVYFIGLCLYAAVLPYGMHVARISWGLLATFSFLFGYILNCKKVYSKFFFFIIATILLLASLYFSAQNPVRDFLNDYDFFFFFDNKDAEVIMIREYKNAF